MSKIPSDAFTFAAGIVACIAEQCESAALSAYKGPQGIVVVPIDADSAAVTVNYPSESAAYGAKRGAHAALRADYRLSELRADSSCFLVERRS